MARVKTAIITRKKHKKILKRAKGYYGAKHYRFRMAKQAVMKSGMYAYVGRKDKKVISENYGYQELMLQQE
jgi:rplT_bact: ribosomal protein L20